MRIGLINVKKILLVYINMSDENEIKEQIKETNDELNQCIERWYQDNFPENLEHGKLNEYKGCCDDTEMNLLVECYHIFSNKGKPENVKKNKKQTLDKDFIRALVAYYYYMMVLENYIFNFIDKKYLKIHEITKIKDYIHDIPDDTSVIRNVLGYRIRVNKDSMILTDNDNNVYDFVLRSFNKDKIDNIVIHNIVDSAKNINSFDYKSYVIQKEKGTELLLEQPLEGKLEEKYKYIYQTDSETGKLIKVVAKSHLACFDNYHTEKSKKYFELFYKKSETINWVSLIRRKILHMNTLGFEGHKGGKRRRMKKNTKKNKRSLQKTRTKRGNL